MSQNLSRGSDTLVALPDWALFAALAVATGTGLLFGVIPALIAAGKDPIQALARH